MKDVDFYVGGALERPVAGGLLGRTFTCVLAEQFSRIRKGDRFWYETSNKDSEFEDGEFALPPFSAANQQKEWF